MKTTLNIDNPHALDTDAYDAAAAEAIGNHPTWEVTRREMEACEGCGYEVGGWIVTYPARDESAVRRMSAKAALLAGWDGVSGCFGKTDWLVDLAAQLKAEGFMGYQT